MSGKLNQTYKYSYDSTAIEITLTNTYRSLTPEELAEAQKIFRAAQDFTKKFYSDGTPRPQEDF